MMASVPGFRFDITGASGSQGLLGPKQSWRAFILPRGAYASQDSTGTLITFDSSATAARFAVGNWIQAGLATGNIRQVGSVGGNSVNVSGANLTVTTNDRIYLIGSTQPTVVGGSATYNTPNTVIYQRDDDAGTTYSNSMITTNSNGLVQGFAAPALYDVLIQDGNQANQGSIIDLPVGVVSGISTTEASIFGATVTISGTLLSKRGPAEIRFAEGFLSGSSTGGIQEAINDLPAAGGTVWLTGRSTYIPSAAVTLVSNLILEGNGAIFQRSSGMNALNLFKDAGALSGVVIRDLTFDNNSQVATVKDIDMTGGATDITIERNRWINLTGRTADLTRIQTSASKGARITIRNNTVSGPGGQQSFNSFQVFDCDNVNVSDNIIDGFGAIKVEGSLAATLVNWNISRNLMKSVDQSNIFCRIQSASSVRTVSITNNTLTDCGKAGIVANTVNASDTGTISEVSITGNAIRGFAKSFADSAIALGGVLTTGAYSVIGGAVKGNVINGLLSDGTDNGLTARGIVIGGDVRDVTTSGNVASNCGRAGIGGSCRDAVIEGNIIDRCVTGITSTAPSAAQEGGIAVYGNALYPTTNVQIVNNTAKNCGPSGTTISYGINVGANNTGTSTSNIFVSNNRCFDDQATKTQDYGINVGSVGSSIPSDCVVINNDCRGNSSGGVQIIGNGVRNITNGNLATNSGTPANLTQAASLTLPAGDLFFGISGTLGAGTSISNMTQTPGRDVMLWAAVGTVGFSSSNTLRLVGASFNVPTGAAVRAYCTGTTWFIFSAAS